MAGGSRLARCYVRNGVLPLAGVNVLFLFQMSTSFFFPSHAQCKCT